ncbi:hypothetical protein GCM10027515_30390 [Schumannella luteola]|uniref:Uncharacterized protein n=1 Tax=Schumannella luteola TaxID=472059 RepID=A0A852YCY2_9MICO|nr:hypothetical protein [Schumannella luteola]NYG99160.1 hypothetical protein [Schumannella luteola]TPX06211.1 hypothetical protein FJ656_02410 [Schumannella luteola]
MIPAQVPPASYPTPAVPPLRSGSPGKASLIIAIVLLVLGMTVQVLAFSTPMIIRSFAVSPAETSAVFA